MPATPTIIGALLGLGTQMYSNALRKLPYMRRISLSPLPFLLFPCSFLRFLITHCVPRSVSRPGAPFPSDLRYFHLPSWCFVWSGRLPWSLGS